MIVAQQRIATNVKTLSQQEEDNFINNLKSKFQNSFQDAAIKQALAELEFETGTNSLFSLLEKLKSTTPFIDPKTLLYNALSPLPSSINNTSDIKTYIIDKLKKTINLNQIELNNEIKGKMSDAFIKLTQELGVADYTKDTRLNNFVDSIKNNPSSTLIGLEDLKNEFVQALTLTNPLTSSINGLVTKTSLFQKIGDYASKIATLDSSISSDRIFLQMLDKVMKNYIDKSLLNVVSSYGRNDWLALKAKDPNAWTEADIEKLVPGFKNYFGKINSKNNHLTYHVTLFENSVNTKGTVVIKANIMNRTYTLLTSPYNAITFKSQISSIELFKNNATNIFRNPNDTEIGIDTLRKLMSNVVKNNDSVMWDKINNAITTPGADEIEIIDNLLMHGSDPTNEAFIGLQTIYGHSIFINWYQNVLKNILDDAEKNGSPNYKLKASIKLKFSNDGHGQYKFKPVLYFEKDVANPTANERGSITAPKAIEVIDSRKKLLELIKDTNLTINVLDVDGYTSGKQALSQNFINRQWSSLNNPLNLEISGYYDDSVGLVIEIIDPSNRNNPNKVSEVITDSVMSLNQLKSQVTNILKDLRGKFGPGQIFEPKTVANNIGNYFDKNQLGNSVKNFTTIIDSLSYWDSIKNITWGNVIKTDTSSKGIDLHGLEFSIQFEGKDLFGLGKKTTTVKTKITIEQEIATQNDVNKARGELVTFKDKLLDGVENNKNLSENEKGDIKYKLDEIIGDFDQNTINSITKEDLAALLEDGKIKIADLDLKINGDTGSSFVDMYEKIKELFGTEFGDEVKQSIIENPESVNAVLNSGLPLNTIREMLENNEFLKNLQEMDSEMLDRFKKANEFYSASKYPYFGGAVALGLLGVVGSGIFTSTIIGNKRLSKTKSKSKIKGNIIISVASAIIGLGTIGTSIMMFIWFFISKGGF